MAGPPPNFWNALSNYVQIEDPSLHGTVERLAKAVSTAIAVHS